MFQPVIKWSGSKRSQANEIIKHFPKEIDTYYEPFCGGCSVLRTLLESDVKANKYVCSDLNTELIELWRMIKSNPDDVSFRYSLLWNELNMDDNKSRKRLYFEMIRERFNKYKNPLDFIIFCQEDPTVQGGDELTFTLQRYHVSGRKQNFS